LVNRTEDGKVEASFSDEILKLVGHTEKPNKSILPKKFRPRSPGRSERRELNGSAVYEVLRRGPPNINLDNILPGHSASHSLRESPVTPLSGSSSNSGDEDAEGVKDDELLGTSSTLPTGGESTTSAPKPPSTETNGLKAQGKRKADEPSWTDDTSRKQKRARHSDSSRRVSSEQYRLLVALRKSNQAAKLYSEAVEELVAYIQEHVVA